MKYESPIAFRQALEQRLLNRSRETGASLVRLRKAVIFDRLLARLVVAAQGRWVLKGALALDFRIGERTRTTKDMDLVRKDDEDAATADLIAAQAVELGDFFYFAIEKTERLRDDDEGGVVRYLVRAELGGRLFEEVVVDIGFEDLFGWPPDHIRGPDLLAFAGLEPVEVPALPIEQHVAEKVHAYTRTYGGGRSSSRVKDLVDLVLVKRSITLDAARLRAALFGLFEARGLHTLPERLPVPPPEWVVPYRKLAGDVGIEPDLAAGHVEAAALIDPVLSGEASGRWDPHGAAWGCRENGSFRNGSAR